MTPNASLISSLWTTILTASGILLYWSNIYNKTCATRNPYLDWFIIVKAKPYNYHMFTITYVYAIRPNINFFWVDQYSHNLTFLTNYLLKISYFRDFIQFSHKNVKLPKLKYLFIPKPNIFILYIKKSKYNYFISEKRNTLINDIK